MSDDALSKATSGSEATPPRVADLTWMAGHWAMERQRDTLDEVWSKPSGDCVMGVFRWIKRGKIWMYELLTIRDEESGPVYRFRHFSDQLRAWEEKDKPLTFAYLSHGPGEIVFENPERDHPRRFVFRMEREDTLLVRLEGYRKGELFVDDFRYTRR